MPSCDCPSPAVLHVRLENLDWPQSTNVCYETTLEPDGSSPLSDKLQ